MFEIFCLGYEPYIPMVFDDPDEHHPAEQWAVIENPKPVVFGIVKRFGKAVPSVHWHK